MLWCVCWQQDGFERQLGSGGAGNDFALQLEWSILQYEVKTAFVSL